MQGTAWHSLPAAWAKVTWCRLLEASLPGETMGGRVVDPTHKAVDGSPAASKMPLVSAAGKPLHASCSQSLALDRGGGSGPPGWSGSPPQVARARGRWGVARTTWGAVGGPGQARAVRASCGLDRSEVAQARRWPGPGSNGPGRWWPGPLRSGLDRSGGPDQARTARAGGGPDRSEVAQAGWMAQVRVGSLA